MAALRCWHLTVLAAGVARRGAWRYAVSLNSCLNTTLTYCLVIPDYIANGVRAIRYAWYGCVADGACCLASRVRLLFFAVGRAAVDRVPSFSSGRKDDAMGLCYYAFPLLPATRASVISSHLSPAYYTVAVVCH
jgi:hypothetical protein